MYYNGIRKQRNKQTKNATAAYWREGLFLARMLEGSSWKCDVCDLSQMKTKMLSRVQGTLDERKRMNKEMKWEEI